MKLKISRTWSKILALYVIAVALLVIFPPSFFLDQYAPTSLMAGTQPVVAKDLSRNPLYIADALMGARFTCEYQCADYGPSGVSYQYGGFIFDAWGDFITCYSITTSGNGIIGSYSYYPYISSIADGGPTESAWTTYSYSVNVIMFYIALILIIAATWMSISSYRKSKMVSS